MSTLLTPARLAYSSEGTPYSEQFGDIYHSKNGGLEQARHVFLGGNKLPQAWQGETHFTILETGFGLGLNFLATWDAWRHDPQRPKRLEYLSVEKHPFDAADLGTLHAHWPELAELSQALRAQWPQLTPGYHRLYFDNGQVCLTLMFGDARKLLPQLDARIDAIYLDGFAPAKNPELWGEEIFKPIARLSHAKTSLATYTVASAVRDELGKAGFETEKLKGFAHKREMTVGRYIGRQTKSAKSQLDKHAIVIGAGLAGCAIAERLAMRGWQIDLIERHAAPAQEASGNLAGIVRPMLSLDDNIASRLSRACFLHALRHWQCLIEQGHELRWYPGGVLHLAKDSEHETLQRNIVESSGFPKEYVRYLDARETTKLLNWPQALGGWLFPTAGHANPASLCQHYLQQHPDRIRHIFNSEANTLQKTQDGWQVRDAHDRVIAQAGIVILASGAEAKCFEQTRQLPIRRVRGQVSHIAEGRMPKLNIALAREGYATPALEGWHCVGASYELQENPNLSEASSKSNLERLEQMLPGSAKELDPKTLDGRVATRAAPTDRLPLVGLLPDDTATLATNATRLDRIPRHAGLYGLLGLGSRGLVWHALAAELLASQLEGDPLPLEKDLIAAIDPARFMLRAHRHG